MKRSDMIEKLFNFHMNNVPDHMRGIPYVEGYVSNNFPWFKEYLDSFLKEIENLGMLPPETENVIIGSGKDNYIVNMWDEE